MKEQPLIIIFILIGALLWKKEIPCSIKIVWGYFLSLAALHSFWTYYIPEFAPQLSNILGWNSALVLVLLTLIPLVILNSTDDFRKKFITCTKWYMAYDSLVLLNESNGVFSATTFDATLIACFILFWDLKKKKDIVGLLICLSAIAFVHGRDAALVVAVSLGIRCLQLINIKFKKKVFYIAISFAILSACTVTAFFYSRLMKDVRFEMWDYFFTWWNQNADQWTGTGPGTFEWVGPTMLDPGPTSRNHGYGFYVMHNDWLQLLFETGIIGFCLSIFGFCYVGWKLKAKNFAAWCGIGMAMIFYYPIHAWPVQMLACILIVESFK